MAGISHWDKTIEILAIIGIVGIVALVVLVFAFTGGFTYTTTVDGNPSVGGAYSNLASSSLMYRSPVGSQSYLSGGVTSLIGEGIIQPISDSTIVYFVDGVSGTNNGQGVSLSGNGGSGDLECGFPDGCIGVCSVQVGDSWASCTGRTEGLFCGDCVWDN